MSQQSRLKDTFGSASPNMKSYEENDWVTMIIEWLLHFSKEIAHITPGVACFIYLL